MNLTCTSCSATNRSVARYCKKCSTRLSFGNSQGLDDLIGMEDKEVPLNIIINSFGGGNTFSVDVEPAGKKVLDGDIFLLCSDGVSDMLNDKEIEEVLAGEEFEDALLQACKNKGGKDNIYPMCWLK